MKFNGIKGALKGKYKGVKAGLEDFKTELFSDEDSEIAGNEDDDDSLKVKLVFIQLGAEQGKSKEFRLVKGEGSVSIGREGESTYAEYAGYRYILAGAGDYLSRDQCLIVYTEKGELLLYHTSAGSAGTYADGVPVGMSPCPLKNGTELAFTNNLGEDNYLAHVRVEFDDSRVSLPG